MKYKFIFLSIQLQFQEQFMFFQSQTFIIINKRNINALFSVFNFRIQKT